MPPTDEKARKEIELVKCIHRMAEGRLDSQAIVEMINDLNAIYTDKFRHRYSEFFPIIAGIAKQNGNDALDILSANLESLTTDIGESASEEFRKQLLKLSDHLNLEIGRRKYYSKTESQISELETRAQALTSDLKSASEGLTEAREKLAKVEKELVEAGKELIKAEEKISSTQTQIVAVLSIFAAIVLAFSGGISFLGHALSSVAEAPILELTFFVLLCGFILFNTIFLLMYIVGKIIGRDISAHCRSNSCTCISGSPRCWALGRLRKRFPYIFWVNVVLIILLAVNLALFHSALRDGVYSIFLTTSNNG